MFKYIGVKIVGALAMTRGDYNKYRGWDIPIDEDGSEEGYLVEYPKGGKTNHPDHSGYISWCPKPQFDEANRACNAMPFGHAIEAARKGLKIARAGWNSDGMFVFLSYPETICAENIRSRHKDSLNFSKTDSAMIVLPCFAMKTATGKVLFGWSPSQTDALTDDWCIVE